MAKIAKTKTAAISEMVDQAAMLNLQIKELTKQLGEMKKTLEDAARADGVKVVSGTAFRVEFGSKEEWDVSFEAMDNFLKRHKKTNLRGNIFTVSKTACDAAFGTEIRKEIGETKTVEYARMTFKKGAANDTDSKR